MASTRSSSSSQRSATPRIASPASLSFIALRVSSRRTPPPPPTTRARRSRQIRIPVTQFIIYESPDHDNPFSDLYHSPSSPSSSFTKPDQDDFDPTASIRNTYRTSSAPKSTTSARIQELQNIPCTEERCKLVAGKILNRGGRSMRYSKRSSTPCRNEYVRSGLSNVVVVAGDD